MISTATAFTSACASLGAGPQMNQIANVSTATRITAGTKYAGDFVRQALNRRARALRFGDHADDVRQQRTGADPLGAHHETTRLVYGAAGHFEPGCFSTGIGSPVSIDSSTALVPSTTTPSTGTRSPGRTRS